jgi:ParB-like chromosome segregation protein Spo0J
MGQVPVIELKGLSAAQKRAYVIADNKLAENAGWDMELLGLELGELDAEGFDLGLLGFGDEDLDHLMLAPSGLADGEPNEAENAGLRQMIFHLLPNQYEQIAEILLQIKETHQPVDPENGHKESNALFWLACFYHNHAL